MAATHQPMIQLKNVSKIYDNGTVGLKDINLNIDKGEFIVVVGLSGAGKSTLLRSINRLQDVSEGDIIIDGINDLKISFGGCCLPVKGDDIVGYISKGNGITIHRKNCHNIVDVTDRIIDAKWNMKSDKKYVSNVIIYTEKKDNILLDIISKTTALNIAVKSVNTIVSDDYNTYDLDVVVPNLEKLNNYINIMEQLPYVTSVIRGNK